MLHRPKIVNEIVPNTDVGDWEVNVVTFCALKFSAMKNELPSNSNV